MPPGKLSSVVAVFETTIQKNHEHNTSDESLVKSSSRERRTRMRRRRQQPGEQPYNLEAEKTSAVKPHKSNRKHVHPHDAKKSQANGDVTSRKGRTAYRNSATSSNDKAPLSPVRTSRGKPIDVACCSPTEETTDTSSAGIPSPQKIQRLPNSLHREHSGEALIAAAQKAISKFSPSKKKMHGSLPIMGNLSNCDFSFSSLPVILPKTGSPHRPELQSLQTKSKNLSIAATKPGAKSYPKSPVPQKGKILSLKDFAIEPEVVHSDEASVPSINTYDPSRNPVKPRNSPHSPMPSPSPNNVCNEYTYQCDYNDPVALLSTPRPPGILLRKHHPVNRNRRVKFLDQQPGGGRRMSLESQNSKDSTPSRPRRATQNTVTGKSTKLAATKIQATFRGYSQWKLARPELLELKLRRIERDHENELIRITERKWLEMDTVRNEVIEEEKRLESQVELGNNLIDHLKRDSAMVRDQTKKLREHCKTLQQSNAHCERMAQMQKENMTTLKDSIDQLQQQHDHYEELRQHFSEEAVQMTQKLSLLSQKVKQEFFYKKSLKDTTKQLVRTIRERCHDEVLLDLISTLSRVENPAEQAQPASCNSFSTTIKSTPTGSLLIEIPGSDERSTVSDITEYGNGMVAKTTRSICSGGNSFAEYDPATILPPLPTMPLIVEE